jgi:polysaccharide chain length determinant protein (PEP-CTERM system associated)
MDRSSRPAPSRQRGSSTASAPAFSLEHYALVLYHRKLIVACTFVLVSIATFVVTWTMPDVYTSETVILVDPQKVPESYVKPTVSGDVRNRLGTLSQQILSATRLQKIIDSLNLYAEERKKLAREEVIMKMRRDIGVSVVSDFGGGQDLQAFRVSYSGKDPRLVARVTNELASLFIEENLKAREQQATGTTEFLQNQLSETRKTLEEQEARLKEFKLKHIGEMPEQQTATLQILGQVQSQLQIVSDSLNRSQQQKAYLQSMMAAQSSAPVVDLDETESKPKTASPAAAPKQPANSAKARLAAALTRYTEDHPEVKRLRRLVADEEAHAADQGAPAPAVQNPATSAPPAVEAKTRSNGPAQPPIAYANPILESQLQAVNAEIEKNKQEQARLAKLASSYQAKLEAVPLREQEITNLVRDYEISKAHYKGLLEKQLSAETATQLEIRQKGERFSVLDPAQPAEKPSRPNRLLLNAGGSLAGLALGLLLALITEILGMTITSAEQVVAASGFPVLEMIPVIVTYQDRIARRRRMLIAAASAGVATAFVCAALVYRYGLRVF